ncbi:MAG: hypothetical protein V3V78_05310 [Candidatus Woesearchaeota archaeon]
MKKRGQITLFIILGIVILVALGLFLFIRSSVVKKALTPEVIPAISEIPAETRPVRIFTEECIASISEEAFRKLGDKGGYVNTAEHGIVVSATSPTEAAGVKFSQNSNLNIPYWWYLKSSNGCGKKVKCVFDSKKPELYAATPGSIQGSSIEAQVNKYVNQNLPACLGDYIFFKEQGFEVVADGEIKTTTVIGEFDVSIFVDYPIKIKRGDVSHKIDRFYVPLDINLKNMYDLAVEITNSQINDYVFEQFTLNILSSFQDLKRNSLPPTEGTTFDIGGGLIWSVQDVREDVQSILTTYVPTLQVPFTLNYERRIFPGDPIKEATYAMDLPLNYDRKYSDLEASFDYLDWPIYFYAGNGGIIRSESIFSLGIGIQRYSTAYDISYPIIVTITDPNALDNDGYSLRFAIESNLRNNEPLTSDFEGLEGAHLFQGSLLCNENQRNSGDIDIFVKDALTDDGVEKTSITFTCGEESCLIGKTDENGKLTTKLPICLGGIVSFQEPDYFISSKYLNTQLGEEDIVEVLAYPYIDKEIIVREQKYVQAQRDIPEFPVDIDNEEHVFLSLTRIPDVMGDPEVVSFAEYWGNQTGTSLMPRLVPGTYEVFGTMMLYEEVIIPADERSTGVSWFEEHVLGAEDSYTIPAVTFPCNEEGCGYNSGGLTLNENTGYLEITAHDLYESDEITFYVIGPTLPTRIEQMSPNIEELSSRFRDKVNPLFKK